MRLRSVLPTAVFISTTVGVLSAIGYYALTSAHPNPANGQSGSFTTWTAIALVGYVLFPILAVLAAALLSDRRVVALRARDRTRPGCA